MVVTSAIQDAHRATTWVSDGTLTVANEATSHVGEAESTGKAVEPLPPGCRVPGVQGGGERKPWWVKFFVDDAISVEV